MINQCKTSLPIAGQSARIGDNKQQSALLVID